MSEPEALDEIAGQRESLFDILKIALKSRGITYAMLAKDLGVSELTVKRLFSDQDCKISRLMEVCEVIGITLTDLTEMHNRHALVPRLMPKKTEEALAKDTNLFRFLGLLLSGMDTTDPEDCYGMDEATVYRSLRELELIGILEVGIDNDFTFTIPLPIRWRFDGPLAEAIAEANVDFLEHAMSKRELSEYTIIIGNRSMTAQSANKIKQGLEELHKQFNYLASQDQLFFDRAELEQHKLLGVTGEVPVHLLLPK